MKKIVITIQVITVIAILAACNKENVSLTNTESMKITASIDNSDITKVGIATTDDEINGTKELTWVSDDKIAIWTLYKSELRPTNSGDFQIFNIDPSTISIDGKNADFTEAASPGKDWSNAGYCLAFYGKISSTDGWKARLNGGDGGNSNALELFFADQDYSEGNPNPNKLFMKSAVFYIDGTEYSGLNNITFNPIVSLVKVPVKNTGASATLKQITLSGSEGYFKGGWAGHRVKKNEGYEGMEPTRWGYLENGAADVKMTINQSMSSTVSYYYIIVPPYNHGTLTVTLTDSENNDKTFTLSSDNFTTVAGKIHRLPVLDWNSKAL